ncbi:MULTISPECIES: (2Fe-2S)-binding protein [Rhizobium/Agrobacterium group]|uniref:(2Fe-2S)-binding protein n=1 Tax=Rhizobium/Agrobacterium group TaxID=227290 RepID=UPI000B3FE73F|nr:MULTISPECIES: (2Fe-2S)-binding protein [Rhizobium/Agrobacterium group]MCF1461158.1 (2Fe-2S)-binding protein [Allorhizobium ampelinum]MCF1483794.1 (2Fe-2S)-binding protein [Allorhizobium ampelinum]NSZ43143.1 (2Fe-2S)-binding protein [Agrobacterium vitis]NTA26800.1 (2Fe-2S)-binding protein [Allorhizobium ampelinum]OVE94904.1 sarcosine oxidase [Allorhizobium ampelinum]
MFRSFEDAPGETVVTFFFNGSNMTARPGMTVAAALLSAGHTALRETPVSGAPRGPFCMMGACYDCLVSIDGETVQACMTIVEPGLKVERVPVHAESE